MTDPRPLLALDIGGTKIAAAAVDVGGRRMYSERTVTPAVTPEAPEGIPTEAEAEVVWRALLNVVTAVGERIAAVDEGATLPPLTEIFSGIGVGCAGPMVWPAGEVSPLTIPVWQRFPLRQRLHDYSGGLPVRVHNDAMCLTIGEHWRGAGKGRDHLMGIVISSGVGGGLISHGWPVEGRTGNAGHIGHLVIDSDGAPCHCGGRGCLETIAAAPPLLAWAQSQGWREHAAPTARDLIDDASRDHPVALAALRRAGSALGAAISSAAALCDLETVVVGGGLAQAGPLLFDPLQEALRLHCGLSFAREVQVVPAALGQEATLVGASALLLSGNTHYWNGD